MSVDPFPQCPSHRRALNPVIANIQLDSEPPDITSPDLNPVAVVSEIQTAEHSVTAADVEMGEPAVLNSQPKDVSSLGSTRSNGRSFV